MEGAPVNPVPPAPQLGAQARPRYAPFPDPRMEKQHRFGSIATRVFRAANADWPSPPPEAAQLPIIPNSSGLRRPRAVGTIGAGGLLTNPPAPTHASR